ncbi:trypsin-like peptidase domain-containing protein [Georgenia halophila]
MSTPNDANRPNDGNQPYPASWPSPASPRSWQGSEHGQHGAQDPNRGDYAQQYGSDQYGSDQYGSDQYGSDQYGGNRYGPDPNPAHQYSQGPYGPHGYGSHSYGSGHSAPTSAEAAGYGPAAPEQRPQDRKRRPGWGAVVAMAAAAALLASVGTAGLTGAFDDDTGGQAQVADPGGSGSTAGPVVTSTTDDPDWANVADAVRPSVVAIQVQTGNGGGQGSGVILDDQGNILTNDHVVGSAENILVTLSDRRQYEADVTGLDPATDLAVITLSDPPDNLEPATLGSSEDIVVGDPVMAVGNPLGLSSTATTGIVSAVDRPVTTNQSQQAPGQDGTTVTTNAIQVDAAINPGNSGGPLFDATGRVIGITSSIAGLPGASSQGSIGLGFAIPVDLASQIADQLIANGVAEHAYLGVYLSDGATEVNDARRTGAQVQQVEPGTPAQEAGLQVGDVIIGINGDTVTGAESLTGFVRQYSSGDEVTLDVVRDGERMEVTAQLATREDEKG